MPDKNKLSYLDGIRGVAAFLVLLHHFLLIFYVSFFTFDPHTSHLHNLEIRYGQSVFSFISNGEFYVYIFFVLSGFVLSRKYFQSNRFEVLVSGAMRRYLRLFIPVAFVMILAFIMIKARLFMNGQVSVITYSAWFGKMWAIPNVFERLIACLKAATMFARDCSFDTTLWTMSIEFAGSMFVFAYLALTHKIRNKLIVLLAVIIYTKWTAQPFLLSFLLGISLNYIEQYIGRYKKGIITAIVPLLIMPGLILGSYPSNSNSAGTLYEHLPDRFMHYSIFFHAIGAYFIILAFVISKPLQHIISLRLFRFLGRISFSLYLIHPLILGSISSYLFLKLYQHMDYNHLVPIIFIITVIVCLPAAWVMTKYVDEPGTNLSKRVYDRWFKEKMAEKPASEGAP